MKRLHTRTKIFFPDPYVVRVQYGSDIAFDQAELKYRTLTKRVYKEIKGTWGYSKLEYEQISQNTPTTQSNIGNIVVYSSFIDSMFAYRGYFVFEDEMDALQFRLSLDTSAVHVKMWPETWFTIHEVMKESE